MTVQPVNMRVAELAPGGEAAVDAFLARIPRGEYRFLKDDVLGDRAGGPTLLDSWTSRPGARVLLAHSDGDIVGLLAVIPGLGWSQHVGELRLVVAPECRGQGVGAALARGGLMAAVDAGLKKVTVEVLADQSSVGALFGDLGFVAEALLADQVLDDRGELHDLLIFSHAVDETFAALSTLGLTETDSI